LVLLISRHPGIIVVIHLISAVIFDLDGLLVDSEPCWEQVRQQMAAEFGLTWPQDDPRAVMNVSTSTWADYMIEQLRLDLSGRFLVVVSTDDLPRGKPAPDVYLEAARRLNVNPETCVWVEDSSSGILAGKAAGMKVIVVPDMRFDPNYEAIRKAEVVLGFLEEFSLELIENIKRIYFSFV